MKHAMMTLLAVAGVLVMGAMGQAAVIPVTSYSFETPALADGGFQGGISAGWTAAGSTYTMNSSDAEFAGTSGSPGTLPGTGDGLHFAILSQQSDVAPLIYQNPGSHTILANQTYTLTTAVGKRLNLAYPTEFDIELRAGSGTGAILASTTLTPADVLDGNFVDVAISFDSAEFAAQVGQSLYIVYSSPLLSSGGPYHGVLDNVRLTAIPEPATMGLLVIGGIGALLRRRRR